VLNANTLAEIKSLPIVMIMRYPSETHGFKPNYTLPTLADVPEVRGSGINLSDLQMRFNR
jgi:hypothetical protein